MRINKRYKIAVIFKLFVLLFSSWALSAQEELPLDYWVFEPISSQKILPKTLLPLSTKNKQIIIKMAENEFEPGSFILRSREDLEGIDIKISDLVSGNNKISSSYIDIKLVKVWYQGDSAWEGRYNKKKTKKLVPELLLNDDELIKLDKKEKRNFVKVSSEQYVDITKPGYQTGSMHLPIKEFSVRDSSHLKNFSLDKHTNKQVWLTIRPSNVEPGIYSGLIKIIDNKKRVKTIPISVVLRNFKLCASPLEHSIYYRASLKPKSQLISSEIKNKTQLENELIDMRDHGITNPAIYQNTNNLDNLDFYLSMRSKIGFSNDTLYFVSIKTGVKRKLYKYDDVAKKIRKIRPILKKHDVNNLYIYGVDEAKGDQLVAQLRLWKQLKNNLGVKIFVAGYTGTYEIVGSELDLFIHARALNPSMAKKFQSVGSKVFSYNNPQVGVENPYIYRKNYGLDLWKSGYDGVMNYAYMTSFVSIWNDFDHKYFRDHNFSYPTVDGVINTIAWEGFREGVDDVRYVATLMEALKKGDLAEELEVEVKEYFHYLQNVENLDLTKTRNQLADFIEKSNGGC